MNAARPTDSLRLIGRKRFFATLLRTAFWSVVCVALYFFVPVTGFNDAASIFRLTVSFAVVCGVIFWQVRSIAHSGLPVLRALEATVVSITLFMLFAALTYVWMSEVNSEAFTESLSRVDALYFALTVFATVGFGDIAPVTQGARAAVTVQIILDLLVIGFGVRIVVGAVNVGKQRLDRET